MIFSKIFDTFIEALNPAPEYKAHKLKCQMIEAFTLCWLPSLLTALNILMVVRDRKFSWQNRVRVVYF
jgi:hypothetical protein